MVMTASDQEELEQLRKSAAKFMTSPLERVFFELDSLLEQPYSARVDSIMPTSAFRVLAKALILLKQELIK